MAPRKHEKGDLAWLATTVQKPRFLSETILCGTTTFWMKTSSSMKVTVDSHDPGPRPFTQMLAFELCMAPSACVRLPRSETVDHACG